MRTPKLLVTGAALLVLVAVPMPAGAVELNGGMSLGGFQAGTVPSLAVSPHMGMLWRMKRDFLFEVHDLCGILPPIRNDGIGVYNTTSIAIGYTSEKANFSAGPSLSTLRNLLLSAAITLLGITACNYTVGECYYLGEGGGSGAVTAGGGVIIPTGPGGTGAYGEAPPKQPQDSTNPPPPDCNIVEDTPCNEDCLKDYDAAALKCGQIENAAQRRACQDSAHAVYTSCRADCERNSNSTCDEKFQACANYGPWSCRKTMPGTSDTKCRACWHRCLSGDPTSGACRTCLF